MLHLGGRSSRSSLRPRVTWSSYRLLGPGVQRRPARKLVSFSSSSSLNASSTRSAITGAGSSSRLIRVSSGIGTDVEMIAANHRPKRQYRYLATSPLDTTTNTTESTTPAPPPAAPMKDEYGAMDDAGETYIYPPGDFVLENGQVLPQAQLRYRTYGTLNEARDNVLVVCHALTGNASLHGWWGSLLGPQRAFDTDRYLVVCCNILGSCYGSTNPNSLDPRTHRPYGLDFPDVSVQDTVRLQLLLLQQQLQVSSIKAVIGGSFGGMQALEFAVQAGSDPSAPWAAFTAQPLSTSSSSSSPQPFVRSVIPMACGVQHTAWQIAISEVQRQAIYRDPAWQRGDYHQATAGLEVARQMGMVTYRTAVGYVRKFAREVAPPSPPYGRQANWQVKSYLEYQGQKFLSRFDPVTYVKLTEQMDSHDVARGRADQAAQVLSRVTIPALVLGIDSDVLYPLNEQVEMASLLPQSQFHVIRSDDGHDGFLLEQEQVGGHITEFLEQVP